MYTLSLQLLFLSLSMHLLAHSAFPTLEESDNRSVGFLYVKKRAAPSRVIDYSSNALLIAPDKCLAALHPFEGDPESGIIIFHLDPRKILEDLTTTPALGEETRGIPDDGTNPLLGKTMSTLVLSAIVAHPTRDLAIIRLDPPLKDIPLARLVLEKPIGNFLQGCMVSYSRTGMEGKDTGGKRHTHKMPLEKAYVPGADGADNLCFIMDPATDTSTSIVHHSHPGDSGAPVFGELGVMGLVYGTYTEKGKKTPLTVVTPLFADGIPDWIQRHLKLGIIAYCRSLLGC